MQARFRPCETPQSGLKYCGHAPCGLKSPPAEARHRGRVPQPSARRYDAADLGVGILSEESISSVEHILSYVLLS